MRGKFSEFDIEIDYEDEHNSMFASLLDDFQTCPECDYEGTLELKHRGYTCPECRTLVIPNS